MCTSRPLTGDFRYSVLVCCIELGHAFREDAAMNPVGGGPRGRIVPWLLDCDLCCRRVLIFGIDNLTLPCTAQSEIRRAWSLGGSVGRL